LQVRQRWRTRGNYENKKKIINQINQIIWERLHKTNPIICALLHESKKKKKGKIREENKIKLD
jgi:hypothetical protein